MLTGDLLSPFYAGQSGTCPEYVTTNRRSWISSFLNRFFISPVFGRTSVQSPNGELSSIAAQLPPFPLRVLIIPSNETAPPPTGPPPPCSLNSNRVTGTSNVFPSARAKYIATC